MGTRQSCFNLGKLFVRQPADTFQATDRLITTDLAVQILVRLTQLLLELVLEGVLTAVDSGLLIHTRVALVC